MQIWNFGDLSIQGGLDRSWGFFLGGGVGGGGVVKAKLLSVVYTFLMSSAQPFFLESK